MQEVHYGRPARPRIVIASTEHAQLLTLADKALDALPRVAEFLLDELHRAFVVPDGTCAANVVRMGSRVVYREESTARVRRVTLTYPHAADIDRNRVSVLTPIGAALIGMSVAQAIDWPTPDGRKEAITVLDVLNGGAVE